MSESKSEQIPGQAGLQLEKARIELKQSQRNCWRDIPWRQSEQIFDSDRATEASKKFALTLFDERAEAMLQRQSDYEVFKTELGAVAGNVVAELEQEWKGVTPGNFDEAHVALTITCIPAVRRALADSQENWRLRFLDAQLKRKEKKELSDSPISPLHELRALGLTVPITDENASRLWITLLRIDAEVRRNRPDRPAEPVQAAYQTIASHIVNGETPDQVLDEMIPQAIFCFASTRPWSRYGKVEFLCRDLASSIIAWKATRLEMRMAAGTESRAAAARSTEGEAPTPTAGNETSVDDESPIEITVKRPLHFVEFYGGRQLSLAAGGPQTAPGWIRRTETFKHSVRGDDPVIIVHTPTADQAGLQARPNPLPAVSNTGTPGFWRGLRPGFQALLMEQRNLGITETHERWLRGSCFYPPGYEDLSRCRVRTGINGQIISDFEDIATRGAFELGCPPETNPVAFWLYCLTRSLLESDRAELLSEVLGDIDSGGIIHDLLTSSAGYCSRLAAESERSARTQTRHTSVAPEAAGEGDQPENAVHAVDKAISKDLAGLLQKVVDQKNITVETWAKDNDFGRTTVFDWKTCRSSGRPLAGKVSVDKAAEIENAVRRDAEALGLITRTDSD